MNVDTAIATRHQQIAAWLAPLDKTALECDGVARATSLLLQRESIRHELLAGELAIDGIGEIGLHFWIKFDDGFVCDLRARMWLGTHPDVPHGIFKPSSAQHYRALHVVDSQSMKPVLFHILTGMALADYPALT